MKGRKENKMSEQIKIEDSVKTYDLVNSEGELLCQISFNPSDVNILKRHAKIQRDLEKLKLSLKDSSGENTAEEFEQLDSIVYEKIDYLLNARVSEKIFSIMGPVSPLASGQFFMEHILEVIGQIIEREQDTKIKKMRAKIDKYTKKYHN